MSSKFLSQEPLPRLKSSSDLSVRLPSLISGHFLPQSRVRCVVSWRQTYTSPREAWSGINGKLQGRSQGRKAILCAIEFGRLWDHSDAHQILAKGWFRFKLCVSCHITLLLGMAFQCPLPPTTPSLPNHHHHHQQQPISSHWEHQSVNVSVLISE